MKNKSLLYLLPLVEGWSAKADLPINCYCRNADAGEIIAMYDKDASRCHKGIVIKEDDECITMTHSIMKEYLDDYELIMNGQYSRVSEEAKQLILERTPESMDFSTVESVLYKSKKRKRYLENRIGIDDIHRYVDEYESVFGEEEIFKS